jgi:hypothetical protein
LWLHATCDAHGKSRLHPLRWELHTLKIGTCSPIKIEG